MSTGEARQALQRETQVDPLCEVIPAFAEGRGDHVAVNGAAAHFNRTLVEVRSKTGACAVISTMLSR